MDAAARVYCVDTSSLIAAWRERYPPTHFKSFWASLHELMARGGLISPEEVAVEITRRDDGLSEWVEQHPDLFVPLDLEQQESLREIMAVHRLLTKDFRGRNRADAFVVALAKSRGAVVVTEEGPGSANRPKIPYVCKSVGVPQISLLDLIKEQGWEF